MMNDKVSNVIYSSAYAIVRFHSKQILKLPLMLIIMLMSLVKSMLKISHVYFAYHQRSYISSHMGRSLQLHSPFFHGNASLPSETKIELDCSFHNY